LNLVSDMHAQPTRSAASCRPAALGLAIWLLAAAPPAARAQEPAAGIAFQDSVTAALRLGKAANKVTVAYFTATWCPWCSKMQTTTLADRGVVALSDRFVWAKVDFTSQPDVAAFFGVRTLPHLILLNAAGEQLAGVSGFQSSAQLTELLRRHVDDAAAPGLLRDQLDAAVSGVAENASAESVGKAVDMLARPDRDGRGHLLEGLAKLPADRWPLLLALMDSPQVAVRAAAATALSQTTRLALPFDPFADARVRAAQVALWRQRLGEAAAAAPAPGPSSRPTEESP
jgi:thioredoxin-like negative regulator of GroEL